MNTFARFLRSSTGATLAVLLAAAVLALVIVALVHGIDQGRSSLQTISCPVPDAYGSLPPAAPSICRQ